MGIKHTFSSSHADGSDATLIQPSNWNADHTITGNVNFNGFGITNCTDVKRTILTGNTTYYVATTGNDTTGSGSLANPWATRQQAVDWVFQNLDLVNSAATNGTTITIQVQDGTYSDDCFISGNYLGAVSGLGFAPSIIIQGNLSTPGNVVLTGNNPFFFYGSQYVSIGGGFKFVNNSATGNAITCDGSIVYINTPLEFGARATAFHILSANHSDVYIAGNYTISGGAISHWWCGDSGQITCSDRTITLTGTPAFSTGFLNSEGGNYDIERNVFVGSATGPQGDTVANGFIYTAGAGFNYLPGNAPIHYSFGGASYDGAYAFPPSTQTSTGYTLASLDASLPVEMNNAGANTLTIPPSSAVMFPIGTNVQVVQLGAGQTTITPGSSVTIRSRVGLKTTGQYAVGRLYKRGTNEWVASGDLTP